MKTRIGHIAYRTADMAKTLDFYVNILGFRHAFSMPDDQGRPWIEYLMSSDGRFIEFFHPGSVPSAGDSSSYMHLCLEVDDCAAAVAELEAKGVAIRVPLNHGCDGNDQAWIRDPDGRDIELMQIFPDSGQAKNRREVTENCTTN